MCMMPETGTNAEFKEAVLGGVICDTCEDCKRPFIPLADTFIGHLCPDCVKRYIFYTPGGSQDFPIMEAYIL